MFADRKIQIIILKIPILSLHDREIEFTDYVQNIISGF